MSSSGITNLTLWCTSIFQIQGFAEVQRAKPSVDCIQWHLVGKQVQTLQITLWVVLPWWLGLIWMGMTCLHACERIYNDLYIRNQDPD